MANNDRPLFDINQGRAVPGTPQLDPFGNARGNPLDPVIPGTLRDQRRIRDSYENPVPVLLPRTSVAPEGARTICFITGAVVGPGATSDLLNFVCKPGATTVFYSYSTILQDFTPAPQALWIPTVDGRRVLQYHGAPGPGQDGSPCNIVAPIEILTPGFCGPAATCQIILEPGQVFRWQGQNLTGAPLFIAIRMEGYVDMSQRLTASKFGD
jgi:hypothetical protein